MKTCPKQRDKMYKDQREKDSLASTIKVNSLHEELKTWQKWRQRCKLGTDPKELVNVLLRGVWVLYELVKSIREENDASIEKEESSKGHWEMLEESQEGQESWNPREEILFRWESDKYQQMLT